MVIKPCFCNNTDPDQFIIKRNKMTCLDCNTTRISSTSKNVEEMIDVWNTRGVCPIDKNDTKIEAINELQKNAEEYLWKHNTLEIRSNYLALLLKQFCSFYSNKLK
jgi:hypothetical protein